MVMHLVNKTSEVKLTQLLSDLRVQSTGWLAIHFHLDRLLDEYKSEYQIKIALNLIHDLLKSHDGTIYLLSDHSILVLCNKVDNVLQEKLVFQLRYLFMDDPLAYNELGQENAAFCTVYDIKRNWQEFSDLCMHYMAMFTRKQPLGVQPIAPAGEKPDAGGPVMERSFPPADKWSDKPDMSASTPGELNVSKLALLERSLRMADLQSAIRRQPVCAVLPDMKVRRVFDELYINIAQLRRVMRSEVDLLSNRWLFKYITNILDERMIDLIRINPSRYLDSPISLNLNVETLLSSWFSEFDATIKPAHKVSIVIELPIIDVFADMAAFSLAVSEVQKLGYRVCIDGLTIASFASINRANLGVDLVKVQWNADKQSDLRANSNSDMVDAVQRAGSNRVILCRCDNKSAVEYGQALGISLFQGRFIDSVLNPTSKVEN
jgi:hypothetical protein